MDKKNRAATSVAPKNTNKDNSVASVFNSLRQSPTANSQQPTEARFARISALLPLELDNCLKEFVVAKRLSGQTDYTKTDCIRHALESYIEHESGSLKKSPYHK
ncbi:MAG: hypothetical protein RR980_06895 [Mucinivorans sp.]